MEQKVPNKRQAAYNPFEINSGDIFMSVYENWRKYDRDFLKNDLRNALIIVLGSNKVFTQTYSESSSDYFKNYSEFRYLRDLKDSEDEDIFPFPDYFLKQYKDGDAYDSIICFNEPFVVKRESYHYDLFFALRITTVNMMKIDEFLNFHLENSFNKDWGEYSNFLTKLCLKHDRLLDGKFSIAIEQYVGQRNATVSSRNEHGDTRSGLTLAQQVLVLFYLLEEAGMYYNQIDKTDVARLIQVLTGRELNAKSIKDTNIYKRVKNILSNSEKAVLKDLQTIRPYLEKLGLINIVEKINKEIKSGQNE